MKVLHLIPRLSFYGGTARKLQLLSRHSTTIRHVFAVSNIEGSEWFQGGEILKIQPARNIFDEIVFISKIMKKHKIGLVSSHFLHMGIVGSLSHLICGVPLVHQEHGTDYLWKDSKLKKMARKFIIQQSRAIVVNSRYTAQCLSSLYPGSRRKINIIYNGVEKPTLDASQDSSKAHDTDSEESCKGKLRIGTIGSFIHSRRYDILVEAVKCLIQIRPEIELTILGEGGPEDARIKELASSTLGDHVCFLPRSQYVGNFLNSLDIYVNCSITEGFGIATCEAMLYEKPVIVTSAGALPEYCIDGHNAIVIPPDDSDALARAILLLAEDKTLRKRLGEQAAIDVKQRFSPHRYVEGINSLFLQLLNDS